MKTIAICIGFLLLIGCNNERSKIAENDFNIKSNLFKDSTIIDTNTDVLDMKLEQPSFPGGDSALVNFINSNTRYPQISVEDSIQGKVFVVCIIEKDGTMSKVEILRGLSSEIDKECLRVTNTFPKWHPAKLEGQNVRYKYAILFSFRLWPSLSYQINGSD